MFITISTIELATQKVDVQVI